MPSQETFKELIRIERLSEPTVRGDVLVVGVSE